jgi:hypothetical protein
MSDAQIDQIVDMSGQLLDPKNVCHVLARIIALPCMRQDVQSGLSRRLLPSR